MEDETRKTDKSHERYVDIGRLGVVLDRQMKMIHSNYGFLMAVFALAAEGDLRKPPPPKAAQESTVEKEPSNTEKQTVEITQVLTIGTIQKKEIRVKPIVQSN